MVRLSDDDDETFVGRAVDAGPFGLCVATAPTASLRVGRSYRIETLVDSRPRESFMGDVRYVRDGYVGIETRERIRLD